MERLGKWGKGQLLGYSGLEGQTDFRAGLVLRTRATAELDIKLPQASGRVVLGEGVPEVEVLLSDGFRLADGTVGVMVDAWHLLVTGGRARLSGDVSGCESLVRDGRLLLGVRGHFRPELIGTDAEVLLSRRVAWLLALPTFGLGEGGTLSSLRKAYSQLKGMVLSPEGGIGCRWSTPDRWPHRRLWLWDSVFHAIGVRHLDASLAHELLRAVLEQQHPDGLIPHMMWPDGCSSVTQPPVLALGVWLVEEVQEDDAFVRWALPRLEAHLEWIMAHRDSDGAGLVEWAIEGDPQCRSGESGMDNSPRFDAATQLDATDFNAYLSLECEIVSRLSVRVGRMNQAYYWQAQHERLNRLMRERLWCEEAGLFMDYDVRRGELTGVAAASGFLPLICGAATERQAALLRANLHDPETFGTPVPVPSISRRCAEAYRKDMWRGPMWVNVNWLIALGLERYGYLEDAAALRRSTRQVEERFCQEYGTFFEFYDDRDELPPPRLERKGCLEEEGDGYHQVFFDYGWSAALFVDLVAREATH